jgi:hypothetical protein
MKSGFTALILFLLVSPDLFAALNPLSHGATPLQYMGLGFRHIIPNGLDHIFFVLGLFFLSRNLTALFWQITAFTLAHSLTFALALYGFVELPAPVVEVVVALSISFVAIENLFSASLSRWRSGIVFAFGLFHGLAFAHTFRESTVPQEDSLAALFSFNIGVELGQLAVVGCALIAVAVFWERSWYRRAVAMPASLLIALMGFYWAGERLASMAH